MKRTLKDRLMGVVIGILIGATMVTTAVATTGKVQKMLDYTDIKITLDGEEVIPKDANGNYVEPFAIEGTTYLPVRAVSSALGLSVDWDDATKTVKLTTPQKEIVSEEGNVIYNENGVKVTCKGQSVDNSYLTINLLVENNSSQDIEVYSDSAVINGFSMSPGGSVDVTAGRKANMKFTVYKTQFQNNGVDMNNITDIEIRFHYWTSNPLKKYSSDFITILKEQ